MPGKVSAHGCAVQSRASGGPRSCARRQWLLFLYLLLSMIPAGLLRAAGTVITPIKAAIPPVINGSLDDSVWAAGPSILGFTSYQPVVGRPSHEETLAWVAYDADNLYFAFRCRDSQRQRIVASLTKRDNIDSEDRVGIILDTHGDQQTAIGLLVNPLGIQQDITIDEKFDFDETEDFVWYSAGVLDEDGYSVEIHIPLKSLRYRSGEITTMGLGFMRYIVRASEISVSPAIDPDHGTALSQLVPVEFNALHYRRNFEFLPSITHTYTDEQGAADNATNLGFTTKVGLTSAVTIDAALNPDFNQVESDASQVEFNIRSAVIYDEKRPFFLEGTENFLVSATGYYNNSSVPVVVHSRKIIDPIAGLKLSGKLAGSHAVSALVAVDESPKTLESSAGNAVFSMARYKKLLNDDSYLGAIATSRELDDGYHRMGGMDGRYRFTRNISMQFNSLHEGHRLSGTSETATARSTDVVFRYASRKYYGDMSYNDTGVGFDLATGFVNRNGYRSVMAGMERKWFPPSEFLKTVRTAYWGRRARDLIHGMGEYGNMMYMGFNMPLATDLTVQYFKDTEIFAAQRFNHARYTVYLESRPWKPVAVRFYLEDGGKPFYDPAAPYQGDERQVFAHVLFQPNDNIAVEGSTTRVRFTERAAGNEVYDIHIQRGKLTYQVNKYLFFRAISEYNDFEENVTTDFLASFTWIPGTVVHFGYGSLYQREDEASAPVNSRRQYEEVKRSVFMKASYNWRL